MPKPKPPGRPWWGRAGRADGEGVATVPPAGDAAAVPDAGEPDVAAIATPAPASRAVTATPARIRGRPGSLRLPSMSERLPSGPARPSRRRVQGHTQQPSWALAEKALRKHPTPRSGQPPWHRSRLARDFRCVLPPADYIKFMIMKIGRASC